MWCFSGVEKKVKVRVEEWYMVKFTGWSGDEEKKASHATGSILIFYLQSTGSTGWEKGSVKWFTFYKYISDWCEKSLGWTSMKGMKH